MKYFCKHFLPLFAAFGLLIGAGCSNIMDPPDRPEEGSLRITVSTSADKSDARTLFPNANFTKLVLSFAGPEDHADVELTGETNQATITDLASGEWTITATGYVTINGKEYPAASGEQAITCNSGTSKELTIPISAKQDGPDGFFSYSVQYPQAKVNDAYLEISEYGTGWNRRNFNLQETASGSITLPAGYYFMTIRLSNDYQTAGHTEIVHIYSNMETKADYTYEDADFVDLITLSGTATITVNGSAPPETMYRGISARDENYNHYNVSLTGTTWSVKLPAFDKETSIYFGVNVESNTYGPMSQDITNPITVKDQSINDIDLGTVNFNRIVISGTANITINGQRPNQADLYLYSDANYTNQVAGFNVNLDNGTWSIGMEPFADETTLYIRVGIYSGNGGYWYYKETGKTVTVSNQDQSGIEVGDIDFGTITLSGTAQYTINSKAPDSAWVYAYLDSNYNYSLGSTSIDTAAGNWSLSIESLDTETPVYFRVEAQSNTYGSMSKNITNATTVKDQNIADINLGTVNFNRITVGGTANVTINGQRPNQANVSFYSDANYSNHVTGGTVNLDNGTWSVSMEPLASETILYIEVAVYSGNAWYHRKTGKTVTVLNQDQSGIDLGDIDFSAITLSGTANITLNGQRPNEALVYLYSDSSYSNQVAGTFVNLDNGTWSTGMEPFAAETTLYIAVEVRSGNGSHRKKIEKTITALNQDLTGIELGDIDFGTITLSGTTNVTLNGNTPDYARVDVRSDSNSLGIASIDKVTGTWSLSIEPFDKETPIYFNVVVDSYTYGYLSKDITITTPTTVKDQSITDIDLGTVNFNRIAVSGTVNVSVNGQRPNQANVNFYSDANYSNYVTNGYVNLDNGTWSIGMDPPAAETTLYIGLEIYSSSGYTHQRKTGKTVTVLDQDKTGIDLGTFTIVE